MEICVLLEKHEKSLKHRFRVGFMNTATFHRKCFHWDCHKYWVNCLVRILPCSILFRHHEPPIFRSEMYENMKFQQRFFTTLCLGFYALKFGIIISVPKIGTYSFVIVILETGWREWKPFECRESPHKALILLCEFHLVLSSSLTPAWNSTTQIIDDGIPKWCNLWLVHESNRFSQVQLIHSRLYSACLLHLRGLTLETHRFVLSLTSEDAAAIIPWIPKVWRISMCHVESNRSDGECEDSNMLCQSHVVCKCLQDVTNLSTNAKPQDKAVQQWRWCRSPYANPQCLHHTSH